MTKSERDEKLLNVLLQHPYLHDGLTASEAFHYLLGRMHDDRRSEKWRSSVRTMSYWLKYRGFRIDKGGPFHKYYWDKTTKDDYAEPPVL
jgi:hypothetical protein